MTRARGAINSSSAVSGLPSYVAAASVQSAVYVAAGVAVVVVVVAAAPAALVAVANAVAGDSNRVAATATALGSRLARGASPAEACALNPALHHGLMAF